MARLETCVVSTPGDSERDTEMISTDLVFSAILGVYSFFSTQVKFTVHHTPFSRHAMIIFSTQIDCNAIVHPSDCGLAIAVLDLGNAIREPSSCASIVNSRSAEVIEPNQ